MATETQLNAIIKKCTKAVMDNRSKDGVDISRDAKRLIAANLKQLANLNTSIVALREKRNIDSVAKSWRVIAYVDGNYACEFTFEYYSNWKAYWNQLPRERKIHSRTKSWYKSCIGAVMRKVCISNGYERVRDNWIITQLTLASGEAELVYRCGEIDHEIRTRTIPYPANNIVIPLIVFV